MKLSDEVLGVLSGLTINGSRVKIAQQLDRRLYVAVDRALQELGGKWNRGQKVHLFAGDAAARIEQALASGEIETQQDLGAFWTPVPLARQLAEWADVRDSLLCLEPSAGTGRIATAMAERTTGSVVCCEWDSARREALFKEGFGVLAPSDFLDVPPMRFYDRVVMNPPFVKVGRGDHLDHVQHAFQMLAPEGRLVAVLPQGVLFRQDRRHRAFREWAEANQGTFEKLPDDSFAESGTRVRTCVLRLPDFR